MTVMLSDDHIDAMREIANVAMGRAGAALAEVFDRRVVLQVPSIEFVDVAGLEERCGPFAHERARHCAVRQSFSGSLSGEAIALHRHDGTVELPPLLGVAPQGDEAAEREFYLDVSNMLIGAIVGQLARQFAFDISYSRPAILVLGAESIDLGTLTTAPWDSALLMSVVFEVESGPFTSLLLVLMPNETVAKLADGLDTFMQGL